jgi:hypothetical protein
MRGVLEQAEGPQFAIEHNGSVVAEVEAEMRRGNQ